VAVFWWTRNDSGYQLFAFDPRQGVYLRRTIDVAEGEAAAALESLALIIATTAEALRFGEGVAMGRATQEELDEAEQELDGRASAEEGEGGATVDSLAEALPPPETEVKLVEHEDEGDEEKRPSPRVGVSLGVSYQGETVGRELPWRSGVAARVFAFGRAGMGPTLSYSYLPPATLDLAPAQGEARLSRHSAALLFSLRRWPTPYLAWQLGAGPQLELWDWRANDVGGLRPHFRLLFEANLRVRVAGPLHLLCNLYAASSVNSLDFVVCAEGESSCSGSQRQVVLSPYWLRAGVELGVGLSF
jgi:hypothetical protein